MVRSQPPMWPQGTHLAFRLLPLEAFSSVVGWLSKRNIPVRLRQPIYQTFCRIAGVDQSRIERDLADFSSFDEFFTRSVALPSSVENGAISSPVDGVISEIGVATRGELVQCKGLDYTLDDLLADPAEAERFVGGSYATLYLAPRDYHRIHAPLGGKVLGYQHIPGSRFPVNGISTRSVPRLFARNERIVTWLDTAVGRVAVIMVAACGVGHMTLSYDPSVKQMAGQRVRYVDPIYLKKGGEVGQFHLGSTVILLFERERVKLTGATGQLVRVGMELGSAVGGAQAASYHVN